MTASLLGVAGATLPTANGATVSSKDRNFRRGTGAAVSVSVNASEILATVPATLVGANVAVYDGLLADTATGTRVREAGIAYLRYPGGSHSDVYHWKTHTAENGAYIDPNATFDNFMTMAQAAGAKPIITANYGSGTAQEAADWVHYANVTKGYGITHWEIGNEVFGNGHYGDSYNWEYDTHTDRSPAAYANACVDYIDAMKAVDPSIKVGVVLTTPGFEPDGQVGPGDSGDWNDVVLAIANTKADFVVIHWYPYSSSTTEAEMLTKPQTNADVVTKVRADLDKWGVSSAEIFFTELNGGKPRNTQAQALWAADAYLTLAAAGVANVTWWNLHNGSAGTSTDVTGATDYDDEGLLSNGTGSEPAAQTPFRSYHGIQMLSRVAQAGDTLLRTFSSSTEVSAHAVRRAGGGMDVLLVNRDPANAQTIELSYTGYQPRPAVTVDTYGLTSTQITSDATGTAISQTIPPYGLVAVHLTAS
ncbi:cellulose-binding protein [Streptomyces sp. NPDC127033]|uniref:cellulose-binding protein n=1 Tax=Streptomyces sp. NPDC127033 TaxID=3347110 RepID=UPI00365FF2A3